MRDPEMISRAQRAAASLERAWERWRAMHGLSAEPMPPVSSYVGYSTEEPWGRPRVVFGVDAREAELLAALLDRLEGVGPFYQGGQSNGHHVATRHAGTGQIGTGQIGTGHAAGDRAASAYPASGPAAIDHPIDGRAIGGHPIGGRADNGYRGTDNGYAGNGYAGNGYAGNGYAGTDGRYASNGRAASAHPADAHPEGARAAGDHPSSAQPAKPSYGPDPILDEVRSRIPAPAQAAEDETGPRRDRAAQPEAAASSVSISETSLDLPRYRDEPEPAVPAGGQDAPRDASYAEPGDAPGQDGENRSGRRRGELSRGTRRRTSSRQRSGTRQTGPHRPLAQGDSPEPAAARARAFDADDAFESDEDWPALLRADSEPDSGAGLAPGAPAGRDEAGPAGQHDAPDTARGHVAADAPPVRSRQDQQEASWDSAANARPDDATDAADDRDDPGWDSARLPSQGQLLEPSWDLAPDRELGTGRGRGTDATARSRESAQDRSTTERGVIERGVIERGVIERGATHRGTTEQNGAASWTRTGEAGRDYLRPDGPASTHWAPVSEPGQARDSGQEPRRDTPGRPDLPSASAAPRTRPAGSGTSVMPELSNPVRPAQRHTDRNDSLTPDLPGPLTAGDVLAGAARQGSMNIGTSRPSPRSDTIAAELAGWASGELPGQASARLAAWAAIGGVPSPGYQSAGASGAGAPGLGTTEVVR